MTLGRHHDPIHQAIGDRRRPLVVRYGLSALLLVAAMAEVWLYANLLGRAFDVPITHWWLSWPLWAPSVLLVRTADWLFSRLWHPVSDRERWVRLTANVALGMTLSLPVVVVFSVL